MLAEMFEDAVECLAEPRAGEGEGGHAELSWLTSVCEWLDATRIAAL